MRIAACLLTAVIFLSACMAPPENVVPLDPASGVRADPALSGVWYSADDDEAILLSIQPDNALGPATLRIAAVVLTDLATAPVHWLAVQAEPTAVDGTTLFNVRRVRGLRYAPAERPPGTIVARARIDDEGLLFLEFMSDRLLREMQEEGRLAARAVRGEYDRVGIEYMALDLSPDDLAGLIRDVGPTACSACASARCIACPRPRRPRP